MHDFKLISHNSECHFLNQFYKVVRYLSMVQIFNHQNKSCTSDCLYYMRSIKKEQDFFTVVEK